MTDEQIDKLRRKGAQAIMQHLWFLGYTQRQLARITDGKVQLEGPHSYAV